MLFFKSLKWEYKLSIIFAASAMILSLIVGIVSINNMAIILGRSLILSILFAILGFSIIFVLRKLVPELFEEKASNDDLENTSINNDTLSEEELQLNDSADVLDNNQSDNEIDNSEPESGLNDNMDSEIINENDLESPVMNSNARLGRHVFKDEGVKYEPKLMAEAIRTMMSKDSE